MIGLLLLVSLAFPVGETTIHVDARSGNDKGDGSADRPFLTIRRALGLREKLPPGPVTIRLGIGHYGAESGEALPLFLPDGVTLQGVSSRWCEIAGVDGQPVVVLPPAGSAGVESVTLKSGAIGIAAAPISSGKKVSARIVDVAIEKIPVGVELATANGVVELEADGLCVTAAETVGLRADGDDRVALALRRCRFSECHDAIDLSAAHPGPDGLDQTVALTDCDFERSGNVAFLRTGQGPDDPPNRSDAAWSFDHCRFFGGPAGVVFEMAARDQRLHFRDCSFLGAQNAAINLSGDGGESAAPTRLERCRFRWDGVGLQLTACGRPVELADCRFEDCGGFALTVAGFGGVASAVTTTGSLFARNGGGARGQIDGEGRIALTFRHCTIADSVGAAIERGRSKSEAFTVAIEQSVLSGNGSDLVRIDPATPVKSFVGGDAGFVDRAARDYRLREDGAARAAAAAGSLGAIGASDVATRPDR